MRKIGYHKSSRQKSCPDLIVNETCNLLIRQDAKLKARPQCGWFETLLYRFVQNGVIELHCHESDATVNSLVSKRLIFFPTIHREHQADVSSFAAH
ncbi:hypothetical protein NK6_5637 [Bradyrhizobium diazoefficiens]|uniref:Uncharacterized protein n=1 Tax=Bradyrhizobium diazoefficiens TaxID=1355477 RepID=A0A0E3VVA0_9BRAD|nr:hypothetical protein NK6_5637 [Bradyrhizobium diazoefficiens]